MFRLIPAPLHRAALRLAHAARKLWWRSCRPRLRGVQILAFDDGGRVLLLRHAYGTGKWMTPGGGLGRREDPVEAAQRELAEEVGCTLADPWLLGVKTENLYGASNAVHTVTGRLRGQPLADRREIVAAALFAPDALPVDMPGQQRSQLPALITAAKAGHRPDAAANPDCLARHPPNLPPPAPKA